MNKTNPETIPSRDPLRIRRCVRAVIETKDGDCLFAIKSLTRHSGPTHHPAINMTTGECDCTCEHFTYRLSPDARAAGVVPSLRAPEFLCKHIRKCLCNLERKGVLLPESMVRIEESSDCRLIALKPAGYAIVDAEDYEWLNQWGWRLHTNGYVFRLQRDYYYQHPVYMHRLLSGATGKMHTDHVNRNKLDNRRRNLRVATAGQNQANKPKPMNNTSGFKGVSRSTSGRWRAETKYDGQYRHLGTFDDPAQAARVYDRAAYAARGAFAHLNFPDEIAQSCSQCGALDAPYEVCDDNGEVVPNQHICRDCIQARMESLDYACDERRMLNVLKRRQML